MLYAKTLAALEGEDRDFLVSRWGGGEDLTEAEVGRLRELLETSGARRATEELIAELTAEALRRLDRVAIPEEVRAELGHLARSVTFRHA